MSGNQTFYSHTLANGLTILGEKMPQVSSAAISILTPVGAASEPEGKEGAATLLVELFNKGAGSWGARELSQEFEDLGIHKSNSSGIEVSIFSAAMLSENLERALELMRVMLLEPRLPEEELNSVKALALQDLKALEDEPSALAMQTLSNKFYSPPFNRSQLGTFEGIQSTSIVDIRSYYENHFLAAPSIISVAGNFDWEKLLVAAEKSFGSWAGRKDLMEVGPSGSKDTITHIEKDTSQVQIALAYPSVTHGDKHYYTAKVANGVLSGGMAGRLFVEVREKRGLVYRVSSSHSASRGRAGVFASAGTTPENAEETLNVMLSEIKGLAKGASEDELQRSKADLKSRLIIQSESTSSRASTLINDWWNLGRIRTLDEIKQGIDEVSSADIGLYYKYVPVAPITLVTLGSKSLEVPK